MRHVVEENRYPTTAAAGKVVVVVSPLRIHHAVVLRFLLNIIAVNRMDMDDGIAVAMVMLADTATVNLPIHVIESGEDAPMIEEAHHHGTSMITVPIVQGVALEVRDVTETEDHAVIVEVRPLVPCPAEVLAPGLGADPIQDQDLGQKKSIKYSQNEAGVVVCRIAGAVIVLAAAVAAVKEVDHHIRKTTLPTVEVQEAVAVGDEDEDDLGMIARLPHLHPLRLHRTKTN